MLDLGWTEILIIGVVALVVIGPRDLPVALHTFGKYIAKLKAMAREFQSGIDDIARQHELKQLQEGINKFSSPEQAIDNYVSGLENQGAKPKAIEPPVEEPESENQIGGAAASPPIVDEPELAPKSDAAARELDPADPELDLAQAAPLEEEPELPLGTSPVARTAEGSGEASEAEATETASAKTPETKPGQTAAS